MIPEVRRAERADVDQLIDLEAEARAGLVEARGGARWLADHPPLGRSWGDRLESDVVLVGEIDGVVVGYLLGHVSAERAFVDAVFVTSLARECGFGDALLALAVERFVELGAHTLDAEALPGDRETKNLYERAGIKARLITVSVDLSTLTPQPT